MDAEDVAVGMVFVIEVVDVVDSGRRVGVVVLVDVVVVVLVVVVILVVVVVYGLFYLVDMSVLWLW